MTSSARNESQIETYFDSGCISKGFMVLYVEFFQNYCKVVYMQKGSLIPMKHILTEMATAY